MDGRTHQSFVITEGEISRFEPIKAMCNKSRHRHHAVRLA